MTNQVHVLPLLPAYFLIATLIVATFTDLASHRIPNLLLAPALSIALLSWVLSGGIGGVLFSLAGLGVGLIMLLPFYAVGAMGAGDVKLLGVAGAFLGPYGALVAGLMTFIAGAVFGFIWICWRTVRPHVLHWVEVLISSHKGLPRLATNSLATQSISGLPYAPAIATGALISIWQQGWFTPAMMS